MASASLAVLKHGRHFSAWSCADWHSEGDCDRDCELFCFLPLVRTLYDVVVECPGFIGIEADWGWGTFFVFGVWG